MTSHDTYADLGEAAWRWVLDQVQWDDGPWIPETVPHDGGPPEERDGMHSGIGGLAHVLAEVRATREWTEEEQALADGIVDRVRSGLPTTEMYSYFDGLVSDLGVLSALGADGASEAVARLAELAADDAGLPADPEFRAAIIGYLEWGTRLAMENSRPGAQVVEHAPTPRWGWGVAPPYQG